MKNALTKRSSLMLSIALVMLAGCATQKTIYHWGDYQQQVYQHFKTEGNSSEEQIAALEQGIVKARANGVPCHPATTPTLACCMPGSASTIRWFNHLKLKRHCFRNHPATSIFC